MVAKAGALLRLGENTVVIEVFSDVVVADDSGGVYRLWGIAGRPDGGFTVAFETEFETTASDTAQDFDAGGNRLGGGGLPGVGATNYVFDSGAATWVAMVEHGGAVPSAYVTGEFANGLSRVDLGGGSAGAVTPIVSSDFGIGSHFFGIDLGNGNDLLVFSANVPPNGSGDIVFKIGGSPHFSIANAGDASGNTDSFSAVALGQGRFAIAFGGGHISEDDFVTNDELIPIAVNVYNPDGSLAAQQLELVAHDEYGLGIMPSRTSIGMLGTGDLLVSWSEYDHLSQFFPVLEARLVTPGGEIASGTFAIDPEITDGSSVLSTIRLSDGSLLVYYENLHEHRFAAVFDVDGNRVGRPVDIFAGDLFSVFSGPYLGSVAALSDMRFVHAAHVDPGPGDTSGGHVVTQIFQVNIDTLTLNGSSNTFAGGADDDIVYGGGGGDVLAGSAGYDMLSGDAGADSLSGGGDVDWLKGGDGSDTLDGGASSDNVFGGSGNDLLLDDGSETADWYDGGSGIDTLRYTSQVSLEVSDGRFIRHTGSGEIGRDSLHSIEKLEGSDFGDVIRFGASITNVDGRGGNDMLFGTNAVETLTGGLGADTLTGGADADRFDFNSVAEIGNAANARDVITDFFQGSDRIDFDGVDALSTAAGVQHFVWLGTAGHTGAGATLRFTQAGGNTLIYGDVDANGSGDFTLQLNGLFNLTAADFTNASITSIQGTAGNDTLAGAPGGKGMLGLDGNDTITGGAGADTIFGGAGADQMTGGLGADQFKWSTAAHTGLAVGTRDIVTDFQKNVDRIDLSAIDANTTIAGNQAFTFLGTAAHTGAGATLRFQQSGGNTIIFGDRDANGAADFAIQLTGLYALTAADFVL